MAEYRGLPPVGSIFNQTVQNVIDGNTPFHVPGSFRVLLECQKYANRVSKTMAACLDETRGVSSHLVRHLEDEFDHIRGLICSERAGKIFPGPFTQLRLLTCSDDLDRWNALLVQLEIQAYYLIPLPGYNPENLKRNVIRAYTTAQTVVQVALELEKSHGFLKHMPHFYFRSLLSAHCIIYKVLRSAYMDFLDRTQAEQAANEVIKSCRQSVVMDGDLPERLGNLLESIWNFAQLARWHEEPVSIFSHRLSASIVFDCLKRWKSDMDSRPKSQPPPANGAETPAAIMVPDPLANIDWSFMDDFDWNIEPTLLGPGIAPGIAP
jgi:transcriptional regulatory protein LEU3